MTKVLLIDKMLTLMRWYRHLAEGFQDESPVDVVTTTTSVADRRQGK